MEAPRSIGTILIIALSGLLLGFDGSLFTGAVVFVKQQFALTDFELGWTVSSHTLSATLSPNVFSAIGRSCRTDPRAPATP